MPAILEAVRGHPPRRFVLQTRGPLILRDLDLLRAIPSVRVSFTISTNREEIRRLYEPHCAPYEERLATVRALRGRQHRDLRHARSASAVRSRRNWPAQRSTRPGAISSATLSTSAPSSRAAPPRVKPHSASAPVHGHQAWLDPEYQTAIVERIASAAAALGLRFGTGPEGFSILTS